jgi:hypothetical protein
VDSIAFLWLKKCVKKVRYVARSNRYSLCRDLASKNSDTYPKLVTESEILLPILGDCIYSPDVIGVLTRMRHDI